MNRSTTDAPTVLSEAQALIYQDLRHWRMKAEASGTLTIDQTYLTLPTDFIAPIVLELTGTHRGVIKRVEERFAQQHYSYDSAGARVSSNPTMYYLAGNGGTPRANFDNAPNDSTYTYTLSYYASPAVLSGSNTTNWLTDFYPRLLRAACMYLGVEFEKGNSQGQFDQTYWQGVYEKTLGIIQARSNMEAAGVDEPMRFS